MLGQQVILSTALIWLLFDGGGASGCRTTRNTNSQGNKPAMPAVQKEKPSPEELKILAEGFHSSITNPFVAILRDAETYSELLKLDDNLPKLDEAFFKSNVVIAAFLGERNTGGYSVEITRDAGHYLITEKKPGKDVMVPQMITAPFKIVSIPASILRADDRMRINPDDAWKAAMRHYRLTAGTFRLSGGFAGIVKEFGLRGRVGIIREGRLATFSYDISEAPPKEGLVPALTGFATGVVEDDGKVTIRKLSARGMVEPPNSGLQATGRFGDGGKKLWLSFTSLPSMIADGYSGEGRIEAEATDLSR